MTRRSTRPPTTPGEILRKEFLEPLGMTQKQLAAHSGYDVKVVNRVVNGRSAVTPAVAIHLSAAFRTSPAFWLNAQTACDLHRAEADAEPLPQPLIPA